MIALSLRSALAGWVAAIFSTFVVLGFYVGGYTFDGSPSEIAVGIGMITFYTTLLSGITVFIVWLFVLLPMAFFLTPHSWILRLPQSLIFGSVAGAALYVTFAMLSGSELTPLFLIGTFTGMATGLCATLSLRKIR
jgi:hypothetical protein